MKHVLFVSLFTFAASASFGADCMLKTKRDACPGQEAKAYKPYNGKVETEDKEAKATDAAACKAAAEKSVKIVRKGTLTKKTVVAMFDGKEVANVSDQAECK